MGRRNRRTNNQKAVRKEHNKKQRQPIDRSYNRRNAYKDYDDVVYDTDTETLAEVVSIVGKKKKKQKYHVKYANEHEMRNVATEIFSDSYWSASYE